MPHPATTTRFGPRLRDARAARGLTRASLARSAGLSWETLRSLESGRTSPTAGTLAALAGVLGLSLDELWYGCERFDTTTEATR